MHQFNVYRIGPEIKLGEIDISFTNASLFMVISSIAILVIFNLGSKKNTLIPNKIQLLAELSYSFIAKMINDTAGSKAKPYFSFIFSLFMFVDFGQRGSPMPQIMEGFYLQHRLHSRQIRIVVVGIVAALILGTVIGFVGNLERAYRLTNKTWAGEETFSSLVNQIQNKTTQPPLVK